jgi:hypothetical protein
MEDTFNKTNEKIIKKFIGDETYILIDENSNIYTFEIDKSIVTIDYNTLTIRIVKNTKEIFITFNELLNYHGTKCITDFTTREIITENYNNGVPHGEWSCYKPYDYWTKHYKNGILDGTFVIYNKLNKIEGSYKDNKYDGSIKYFDVVSKISNLVKTEVYKDGIFYDSINHIKEKDEKTYIPLAVIGSEKCLFWKR